MRQGLSARGCMSSEDSTESLQPACYLSRIPGETAADSLRHPIAAYSFSGLKLTAISYDLRGMLRGEQLISHIDDRHYALILQLEGRGAVMRGETETTLKTGDMIIIDMASTTLSRVFAQSRQLCVKLPRALLQARLSSGAIAMACLIEGSGVFGRLLRSLIDALTGAAGTLSHREERGIRDALIDLAVAALCAELEPPLELRVFRPTAVRHWALLRQSIETLLSDPELSPAKVAAEHNISTRHLHRLFKHAGTSFGEYVRARRLARCRNDLADQRLAALPVTEIAFRWGFNDSSHFSRCFKKTFGCTARDFRAACGAGRRIPYRGDGAISSLGV